MNFSPMLPPALALVISVGWLGTRWQVLAGLEKQRANLRRQAASAAHNADPADGPAAPAGGRLDWSSLAAQALKVNRTGAGHKKLMERFSAMPKEELLKAIEDVPQMNSDAKWILREMLIQALVERDPGFALNHLLPLADTGRRGAVHYILAQGMKSWASKDPAAAGRWFDAEAEKGTFASKRLDGFSEQRQSLQSALIGALMTSDPAEATKRLAALPESSRGSALNDRANYPIEEAGQAAFATMVRELMPPDRRTGLLANQARQLASTGGFPQVEGYLDRIDPSPEERSACVQNAATGWLSGLANRSKITASDVDSLREWVAAEAPEVTDRATGYALAGLYRTDFTADAELALRYNGAGDEVLISFLNGLGPERERKARVWAETIADQRLRALVISKLR